MFRCRMWKPLRGGMFSERVLAFMEIVHEENPGLLEDSRGLKEWLRSRLESNIWDREAAERLDEWWPVLMAHVGELYRRRGLPTQALPYFQESLRLERLEKEGESFIGL